MKSIAFIYCMHDSNNYNILLYFPLMHCCVYSIISRRTMAYKELLPDYLTFMLYISGLNSESDKPNELFTNSKVTKKRLSLRWLTLTQTRRTQQILHLCNIDGTRNCTASSETCTL